MYIQCRGFAEVVNLRLSNVCHVQSNSAKNSISTGNSSLEENPVKAWAIYIPTLSKVRTGKYQLFNLS